MRFLASVLVAVSLFLPPAAARALGGSLVASPNAVYLGQPVAFVASIPSLTAVITGTLAFGDGSSAPVVGSGTLSHTYAAPGRYLATLATSSGAILAQSPVFVQARTALVPTGSIYSVTPTLSPVLAGSDISLIVTYALAVPNAFFTTNVPSVQFVVDLLDSRGQLLRRSDPFTLTSTAATGTQIAHIPYSVPVDGAGAYQVRVYMRAPNGGTIALAQPTPLLVLSGPDPSPSLKNTLHANGAIEIGPRAGSSGAGTFNAAMATSLLWPNASLGLTGLFDPVSGRSDPMLTYRTGAPKTPQSPDAASSGASTTFALPQNGVSASAGLEQSSLPSLMGTGDQIRGIDATAQDGAFTYHAASGYTQLASTGGESYANILDIGHALANKGSVRLTEFATSGAAQNSSQTLALQYQQQLIRNVTVLAADAANGSDAADTIAATYANGGTSGTLQYENSGESIALGGAPGAFNDRAHFAAQMQTSVTRTALVAFGWSRDDSRSAFSRSTDAFGTLILNKPNLPTITFTLRRDDLLSPDTSTSNDQIALGITKSAATWNLALNATLSALRDFLGTSSATTRTGTLQYTHQAGYHTLSFGVNGTSVGGTSATAQTGETLAYGFPFGMTTKGRAFELQLEGDNSNTHSLAASGIDRTLSAILSYHLSPRAAAGVRYELRRHDDVMPTLSNTAAALRLRLDLQL